MPDDTSTQVADVGFAEFVAVLLVETLDSIVAAHAGQEDRLRALEAAADLTPEEVAATSITAGMVDAALAELFGDGEGGTTVRTGGQVPPAEDLKELGLELPTRSDGLTSADVTRIRNAVALLLARRHLTSVQDVARRGVPRVLVEGGTLRAKLAFSTVRTPSGTTAATSGTTPRPSRSLAPGLSPAVARAATAGLTVERLRDLDRLRTLTLRPEIVDGIRDLRLQVRPPTLDPAPGTEGPRADVYGEVEIRFRTAD